MSQQRYIKSYPSYMDSPIWRDDGVFKLYHYCLYKSSHNAYVWHGQQINPGELPISIRSASSELGWSVNKLQQKLAELQKSGYISVSACSRGTLIRVLGWFNHQESVPCIDYSNTPVSRNDTRINYRYSPVSEADTPRIENRYGSVFARSISPRFKQLMLATKESWKCPLPNRYPWLLQVFILQRFRNS